MASPEASHDRRGPLVITLVLVVAAILVLLAALIVIPPASMVMLTGTVVATEYSPFLSLLALLWCLPASRLLRGRGPLRAIAITALVLAAATALVPFTRFASIAAAASVQMGDEDAPAFSLITTFRGLPTFGDVRDRTIRYTAADGASLTMQLYTCPDTIARPVVVVIYGGAWRSGASTDHAEPNRALAASGFAVASIDYRHAPRFPHPAQLDDIRRSLALLRDSAAVWRLDMTRVALLGRSSGGHLAELAAYAPGGVPVQAVVAIYAPHDLVQGYRDLPSPDPIGVQGVLRDFLGGTPETRPAAYRDASPSSYVRPGLPPTLLLYGAKDHIVKPEFNRAAAMKLRAAGVRVISVEVPWGEHGFDVVPGGLGSQLAYGVVSRFLQRELQSRREP